MLHNDKLSDSIALGDSMSANITNEKVNLADVIKQSRLYNSMTLRDLEQITGISFSQLSKIERGESIPSKENIELLAKALKLDVNYLLVLAGYVPYEISVGVAQLIYELWGSKDETTNSINADDIILLRNNMAQVAIDAKIPDKIPIELREDTEEDWARFIKEMKRKNITPDNLRDVLAFAHNLKKYIKNIDFLE